MFNVLKTAGPLAMFRDARLAIPANKVVTFAFVKLPVVMKALAVLSVVVTFALDAVRFVVVTVFVTARF